MKIEVRNATQLLLARAECKAVRNRKCKGLDKPGSFPSSRADIYIITSARCTYICQRDFERSRVPYAIAVSMAHRIVSIYNERYGRIRGECSGNAHCIIALSSFPRAVVQCRAPTSPAIQALYILEPTPVATRRKCQGSLMHEAPLLPGTP